MLWCIRVWKCFFQLVWVGCYVNDWHNRSLSWLTAQVSVAIIYPYVFWSVYLDVTMHYAKCCWKRKWSVNGFSRPPTGPPLVSIGWPNCLPPCWPVVGAKWACCWILQQWPSTLHVSALPSFDKPVWKVLKYCSFSSLSGLHLCLRVSVCACMCREKK